MPACIGFLVCFGALAQTPPAAAPYCDIARPITWSARDTRTTKQEIDRENRKWRRLCGTARSVRR